MSSTLKTRAYQHIRESLLTGAWPEGAPVSPAKLARRIGISYTPVREAIIQLTAEGLIEQLPEGGVCPKRLSRQELQDMFELREMLEAGAARLAAGRITEAELQELRRICNEHLGVMKQVMEQIRVMPVTRYEGDLCERAHKLDVLFHLSMVIASRNRRVMKTLGDLHILTRVLRSRLAPPGKSALRHVAEVYKYHRRMLRALENRDAEAAGMWTAKHIQAAKQHHLAMYDWLHSVIQNTQTIERDDWPKEVIKMLSQMEERVAHQADEESN